ncbi:hypothetical protein [Bartonella taylorii]|uniref:hypothetical protein n=1 Tax=Bartonella taylorii TaxID=33046 RepID=UPI001ABB96E3|nr:hypothetical protein [Bartonella taylorii]
MLKPVLRLFLLFLFVIHTQLTMAKEKETDNKFNFPHVIANYTLTEDLLLKMEKIEKEECENLPPESKVSNIPFYSSIEEFTAYISDQPKLMNILKNNNITPRDFAVSCNALQTTLIMLYENIYYENPKEKDSLFHERNTVVSDNLEFGKKHMHRIWTVVSKVCDCLI